MDQTALFHHVFPILKKGLPLLCLEPRSLLPCNPVVDGSGRVVDVSGNVSLLKILQTRKDWDTTSTICFIFDLIMIPVF